jgi:hypothetical protein
MYAVTVFPALLHYIGQVDSLLRSLFNWLALGKVPEESLKGVFGDQQGAWDGTGMGKSIVRAGQQRMGQGHSAV